MDEQLKKYPVSLVVITLNEEANIERCLASARWADDFVVLDSGSHDRTRDCAQALGARVFSEPFRGFRAQKQRAVELAKYPWILSLDADEVLSPELSREIQGLFARGEPYADGFRIPRLSYHLGRWIRGGGWYPDFQTRLFHRARAQWVGGQVHERVSAVQTVTLTNPILHFVFRDLAHQVETNNRYSTLGAEDVLANHPQAHSAWLIWRMVTKPVSKFFETYLLKLGFRDGLPGLIISVSAGYSIFLKYAKAWEIKKVRRNQ